MNTFLQEVFKDLESRFTSKETHACWNLAKIRKATPELHWEKTQFTTDSIISEITDPADGQKYTVEIKPIRKQIPKDPDEGHEYTVSQDGEGYVHNDDRRECARKRDGK